MKSLTRALAATTMAVMIAAAQSVPTYLITTVAGTTQFVGDGGPATSAQLPGGFSVAVSADREIYVTATVRVLKITAQQTIRTVAGVGYGSGWGDGGPAVLASLTAGGIVLDSSGNLYISDTYADRVRKVTPEGVIQAFAGSGERGYCGDGGPATSACLFLPGALAVDAAGNLYISDTSNHRVRKVSPGGVITTAAGNGSTGSGGDDGPATSASVGSPKSLACDAAGNLYISQPLQRRVRKVDPQGVIRTVAGNGSTGFGGDGISAVAGPLAPNGIAIDAVGNLYVAESESRRVRKVSPLGILSTVAGTGDCCFRGDGGPATEAWMSPSEVAVDNAGNLYVSDAGGRLRQVSPDGIINTIAGGGIGDGALAIKAALSSPSSVAMSLDGSFFIAETGGHRIRKVGADGVIQTVVGLGVAGFAGEGTPATEALLKEPGGVALDSAGNLYVADTGNNRIRKVDRSGIITTFAGTGIPGLGGDGGPARNARLSAPLGLVVDALGNLLFADSLNGRIRVVSPAGTISTVAGSEPGFGGDEGPAVAARLNHPSQIAVDSSMNLYIADSYNYRVRKVTPAGLITTVAGANEEFSSVGGVAVDAGGNIFLSDPSRYRVFRVPPGGAPTRIAGTDLPNLGGDAGPATSAGIGRPGALAVGPRGEVYFVGADLVRKLEPANIFPIGVVSAASFLPQFIAPGEIVSIFWADMGPAQPAVASPGPGGRFPTSLADTKVFFEDIQAPLLYVDRNQINAIVPYGLAGRPGTRLYVEYQGRKSNVVELAMAAASPALFMLGASGQGAILNQDFMVNSASNPAARGSIVMFYGTGEGATSPAGVDGLTAVSEPPKPVLPIRVQIGGIEAEVHYAGGVQTLVAGVMQVNVRVPQGVTPGNAVNAVLMVGGASSQRRVTMAVQ